MGEAFAGRTVGKKAMLWGALAQSIPDIDFVAAFWLKTTDNLLAHRGITHSILFSVTAAVIMGIIAERCHRSHNISLARWLAFFGAAILTHIFLDAFNNYGVGWFEPFSNTRISFNVMYVADPFFSASPALAALVLLFLRKKNLYRTGWWKAGLGICFIYFWYSVYNKITVDKKVRTALAQQHILSAKILTTPAPLQTWLWFVAAGTDSGFYTGYVSVFDKSNDLNLHYFPQNEHLLQTVPDKKDVQNLIRFSQGFFTAEQRQDSIIFNDLRFGQVLGWENPKEEFVFHYYLVHDADNTLVVQRGRFEKWNKRSLPVFWHRIKGN